MGGFFVHTGIVAKVQSSVEEYPTGMVREIQFPNQLR